jgi:hypothetical protein
VVPPIKPKKKTTKPRKPLGRRLGEGLRATGEFSRDALQRPGSIPDKAHGAFRTWFRRVWDVRGGGLYAVGFAIAFLIFEITEIVTDDIPQFIAMNNVFSSEIVGFGIQFIIDTMVNFVKALIWPVYVVTLWPPAGAIALAVAFLLFPRYVKPRVERYLFHDQ